YLSDFEPKSAAQGWGTLGRDRSVGGTPIQLGATQYRRGVGTHADAQIEYDLAGQYNRFTAIAGVDANNAGDIDPSPGGPALQQHLAGRNATMQFEVWADGRLIWQSGPMTSADAAQPIDLDVTGVRTLRLIVCSMNDNIDYAHADWAEAKLTRTP